MPNAAGWDLCLDSAAAKKVIHQDLSASCYNPCPSSSSLSDPQWWSLPMFPSDPCEVRLKWTSGKVSPILSDLDVHLGFSFFPTGDTKGPGGPLDTIPCWPGGRSMLSEWSHSCNSSKVVLLCLRGPGMGASASPLDFGIFTMVSCLWIVPNLSSQEGD